MGAIDEWAQITTERLARQSWMETLLRWTGRSGEVSVPDTSSTLAALDAGGVDIALLSTWHGPQSHLSATKQWRRRSTPRLIGFECSTLIRHSLQKSMPVGLVPMLGTRY